MKKYILFMLLLLITSQVYGLTANEYWARRGNLGAQNRSLDPLYTLFDDVDGVLGSGGSLSTERILFSEETGDPASTEGTLYYNATSELLRLRKAGSWVNLAVESGTVSLDVAYNNGNAIDVDGTAVTLTVSDNDNNVALAIIQNDSTNNVDGMSITMASSNTGDALYINGVTGSTDIRGDSWNMSQSGILTLKNGGIINNTTDNEIEFIENGEEFSFAFNGNTLTYATDTGIDSIAFGVVDALSGVASIAGDTGADFALSAANTGTFNFTIAQTGAGDNELRLTSAGTAANAIALTTATGGQTFTAATAIVGTSAAGAISWTSTGGDVTLDATNKSIKLDSGEAAVDDAIVIVTTGAGSGIQITSLADIDITTTGASGEDISITNTGGSILLSASEAAVNAISLQATAGAVDIDAIGAEAGDITMNAADNMAITAADTLTLTGTTAGVLTSPSLTLGSTTSTAATILQSGTGDLALTSTDDITLTVATAVGDAIVLTNTVGTNVTEDSMAIEIRATAGGINIQSDASIDGDTVVLRVDGGATADMLLHNDAGTGLDCINLLADVGGVTITAALPVVITNAFELPVVYLAANDATLTILANDSGQTHIFPDIDADTVVALPAAAAGLRYHFVYGGGAEDAQDWSIETGNNTNYYLGGVVTHDDDDGDTVVYFSDESDDSKISVLTPSAGTTIDIWCDGTNWWITGNIVSGTDTSVVFSNI